MRVRIALGWNLFIGLVQGNKAVSMLAAARNFGLWVRLCLVYYSAKDVYIDGYRQNYTRDFVIIQFL